MTLLPANRPAQFSAIEAYLKTLSIKITLPEAGGSCEFLPMPFTGSGNSLTLDQAKELANGNGKIEIRREIGAEPLPSVPEASFYLEISAPKAALGLAYKANYVDFSTLDYELGRTGVFCIDLVFEEPPSHSMNPLAAKYVRIALECGTVLNSDNAQTVRRVASYVWRLYAQTNHGGFQLRKMNEDHPKDSLFYIDAQDLDPNAEDFEDVCVFLHESVYDQLDDHLNDPSQLHIYSLIAYEVLRTVLDLSISTAKLDSNEEYSPLALRIARTVSDSSITAEDLLDNYREQPYEILGRLQSRMLLLTRTQDLFNRPENDDEELDL